MQSFGRIFFAFIFITIYNLIKNKGSLEIFKIKSKDYGLFILNGLVGFSAMAAAFTLSVLYTSIANTYFLLYTAPVWVVILSYIFLKEKIHPSTLIAIAVSLTGLFLLFNPSDIYGNLLGNVFGVIVGIAFGSYFVITGILRRFYSSPIVTFWTQFIGSLGLFPLIYLFDNKFQFTHTIQEWLPVVGAGAVVFIGYALLNYGLGKIKASMGSILSLFEPLSAVMYGLIFFSEVPGLTALVGSMFILGGIVYLTTYQKS